MAVRTSTWKGAGRGATRGRRRFTLVALTAVLAAGCGGGGDAKPKAASAPATVWSHGRIAFGVLAPLSGADEARGRDLADGATLAAEDLNIRGGVIGKQVTLAETDDACTAAGGRAGARTLARHKDLGGVLGGICADAAAAAARAFARDDIPFLVTSANDPSIVDAKRTPTTYLTDGTPYQAALATVHWLVYEKAQRLAVVSDDDAAAKTLAKEVLGLAAPVPKAVSRQTVAADGQDWAQAAKTALAGKPDIVYWAGAAERGGRLAAALDAAGFGGGFVASAQSESPAFLAAAGAAAEAAVVIAPASPQNLPDAADFTKRFKDRFGHAPTRDAMLAYDALRALAQAVTQTGKIDPKLNSVQVMQLRDDFTGFLGGMRFATDHTIQYDNNIALVVEDGAFTLADTLRSNTGG